MNIIIAGGGKVGQTLARQLSAEGHDLTLIDRDPMVLEKSLERYDAMMVAGNCASKDVLLSAGVAEADLLIAATAMWGLGDTAAALIGGRLGKHPIRLPLADPQKTVEGTVAMFAVALVTGIVTLCVFSPLPLWQCLLCAAAGAAVGAYVELISRAGTDTVTVPVSVGAVLWLVTLI